MSIFKVILAITLLTIGQVSTSNQTTAKESSFNQITAQNATTNLTSPCNENVNLQNKLFASFYVIVLVVGIVGNSFAISVILFTRRLRSQVTYRFLVSLAVADIGFSIFVVTLSVDKSLRNGNFCHSLAMCYMSIFCDYMFGMASVTHLLIIAIDRFTAINFPFSYAVYFTSNKVLFYITSIWLYVSIWAALGVIPLRPGNETKITRYTQVVVCHQYNKEYVTSFAIIIYFLPMIATTVLHLIIVRIAMQQASAIRKQTVYLQQSANHKSQKRDRRLGRDLRAAKTVAVVFIAYFVCWVPNFIITLIAYWNTDVIKEFYQYHPTVYKFVSIVFHKILPPLNSCLNPCIYFLFSQNFRSAFKDMTRKWLHRPRADFISTHEKTPKTSISSYKNTTSKEEGTILSNNNNYYELSSHKQSQHSRLFHENSL